MSELSVVKICISCMRRLQPYLRNRVKSRIGRLYGLGDEMSKQEDTMAILKLYELRRDEQMRAARQWYFSEFAPATAMDIIALYRGGERASANFRMVVSYWDTAASLVLNGGIDQKLFLDANILQ